MENYFYCIFNINNVETLIYIFINMLLLEVHIHLCYYMYCMYVNMYVHIIIFSAVAVLVSRSMYEALCVLLSVVYLTNAANFYVKPDSGYPCVYQNCHGLNYYVNKSVGSNSRLRFLPGRYILQGDFVIRDLHSISLIGTSASTNSTPTTIIQCNSSVSIAMINITYLTIRNMIIKDCGPVQLGVSTDEQEHGLFHKQALTINDCGSILLANLKFINCTNRDLLLINSKKDSLIMDVSCHGIALVYNSTKPSDAYVEIKRYILVSAYMEYRYPILLALQRYSAVINVRILDTSFISQNNLLVLHATFRQYGGKAYYLHSIQFVNCHFLDNRINSLLTANGEKIFTCSVVLKIRFVSCQFIGNKILQHDHLIDIVRGNLRIALILTDCLFHFNSNLQLINFVTAESFFCSQASAIFIKETTFSFNNLSRYLINASRAALHLDGLVSFTNINSFQGIIALTIQKYISKSVLKFRGYIVILNNIGQNFLHFTGKCSDQHIAIEENTNVLIKHNIFRHAFASCDLDAEATTEPHPLCFFQFHSNNIDLSSKFYYHKFLNFSVTFENIATVMVAGYKEYTVFTHCSWIPGSAFEKIIPLDVYRRFVSFKGNEFVPWNRKKNWCICQNNSHYDCKIDQLREIFPGEKIVMSLSVHSLNGFLYNSYPGFYKRSFSTACEVPGIVDVKLTYKQCTKLEFLIASNKSDWCELFIVNYRSPLINGYGAEFFYVAFLPGCPIGFTKYTSKCQCDHNLGYIGVFSCDINNRTILRPANSWITATTKNYSHNYTVSQKCPFDYCLPHSSHLDLSNPNSQCQFNRSGLLCGQCQQGLSAVFASSQCHHCSNIFLLLVLVFAVLGVLMVLTMFAINFTITDGTINGFIFYVNIASINDSIFFPLHQFSYVFISIANLDLGIQTCFYNGMDGYAKMWLQLLFPLYLILIAVSLIITSRHSTTVQRLTARRALPVLATLFLLSYTKILRTVSNVIFSYTTVITLPRHSTRSLWSVDGNIAVFGMKFLILFVTCLVLFLMMVPYSLILTFVRFFMKFRLIARLKPLLDAYQGPYKDKCYYWTGLQLVLRAVLFAVSSLDRNINLTIGAVLITLISGIHGLLRPLRSELQNYQEFILLVNLQGLYVFSLYGQDATYIIFVNILVVIAMIHFSIIMMYHIITYTRIGDQIVSVCTSTRVAMRVIRSIVGFSFSAAKHPDDIPMNELPEGAYCEYREPLVGL